MRNLAYRLLRCRYTEIVTGTGYGGTKSRTIRCERWLHLGKDHR